MNSKLLLAAIIAVLTSTCAANAAALGQMFKLNFYDDPSPKTVSHDGVEVTVQAIPEDYTERTIVSIRVPGTQTAMVDLGTTTRGIARYVGIGRLANTDAQPSVILQNYSGGAHCCTEIKIVQPTLGKLKVIDLVDSWDGGLLNDFPTDIDSDGVADFQLSDGRFLYQFGTYAGSWPPPMVFNVFKGQVVDVTAQPSFQSVFEKFSLEAKKACANLADKDRNGACAGYVAAESRLGRLPAALSFAERAAVTTTSDDLPSECRGELVNYRCPDGQSTEFSTFGPAIRWFLAKNGYID